MKPIITVENVAKEYRLGERVRYRTFRETVEDAVSAPFRRVRSALRRNSAPRHAGETVWALNDVSFQVMPGEVVGLIGGNGAGKSTLLKVLSRITEPTRGRVDLYGRVGSLLEVGTGFHPELSGRENIFLNGAVLGMKRKEIARKFDEIVAFAEVDKFIDTPVKRYSSGMYLRLAFAVAAHLEPEILVVDEVLAVGDAAFQQKCLGKMGSVASEGRTVLFVSHNMSAIASLCPTSIWLESGRVAFQGESGAAISKYYEATRAKGGIELESRRDRSGNGRLRFKEFYLEDTDGAQVLTAHAGETVRIVLEYTTDEDLRDTDLTVNLVFLNERGHRLFSVPSQVTHSQLATSAREGRFVCTIPELPLMPGVYDLHLSCTIDKDLADKLSYGAHLTVVEGDFFGTRELPHSTLGDLLVHHDWVAEPVGSESRAAVG